MYRRTVLRSRSTRRAIAETPTPWRCSSRIMTISPSRTNDASPKAEKGHHRSLELATRQALPKIDCPAGTEEAEGEAAAEAGADAEADTPDLGPVSATDEPRYKL